MKQQNGTKPHLVASSPDGHEELWDAQRRSIGQEVRLFEQISQELKDPAFTARFSALDETEQRLIILSVLLKLHEKMDCAIRAKMQMVRAIERVYNYRSPILTSAQKRQIDRNKTRLPRRRAV